MREWQEKNTGIIRYTGRFTLSQGAVDMEIQANRDRKENFGECFTYEEAVERLKASNVIGKKCTVCKWEKGE